MATSNTTVGQSTTTTRTFERNAERKANRGIYWALGLAVLVVLAIIVARNYSMRPAAVTTPADTSAVTPPVTNGMNSNGNNANGVGTDSSQTMPGNGTDTYGTTPIAPDASSTTAPVAPAPEPAAQ